MNANATPTPTDSGRDPEEKIQHLSAAARAAYRRWRAERTVADLDPLILAILEDHLPRKLGTPLSAYPGGTLLMEELGFDSLAIVEITFFTESLFDITIANEELLPLRTLDDLRQFVRRKVTAATG